MKNNDQPVLLVIVLLILMGCNGPADNKSAAVSDPVLSPRLAEITENLFQEESTLFSISLSPVQTDYHLPAMHSFAFATYEGMWIVLGGQVAGFHGTADDPPPFMRSIANDSLWLIDPVNGASYSVPVPAQFQPALTVTNPQYYQEGETLYVCGGYTVSDATQPRFNTTSNYLVGVNLPNYLQYVQSGGQAPAADQVFQIALQDDFVRVTGGALMIVNDYFYLVGGQNFEGVYTVGSTGDYTNAIRSFTLEQNGSDWSLGTIDSLVDTVNLHRRDFNLVPYLSSGGLQEAIILGGVFTPEDLSYNNPVYITGLATGTPAITVGLSEQSCNQYSCAVACMWIAPQVEGMIYALLGGITYKQYSPATNGLVIGDNGVPMPFSNLVDFIVSDTDTLVELVQTPPQPLLPGYLGTNAAFIPIPQFVTDSYPNILDLSKVFMDTTTAATIGYLFGGILSEGPTSGTTANGIVRTYANPVLYSVDLSLDGNQNVETRPQ